VKRRTKAEQLQKYLESTESTLEQRGAASQLRAPLLEGERLRVCPQGPFSWTTPRGRLTRIRAGGASKATIPPSKKKVSCGGTPKEVDDGLSSKNGNGAWTSGTSPLSSEA